MANINRAKGKPPVKIEDFMHFLPKKPKVEMTEEAIMQVGLQLAAVFGQKP